MKFFQRTAQRLKRSEAGFSLVEVMVVVLILALLAAIIAPNVIGRLGGAKTRTASVQIENLAASLELYLIDTGRYPSTEAGLDALVSAPTEASGWTGPYLRRGGVPLDPWGRAYVYRSEAPDHFELVSFGRDGAEGGSGEDSDLSTSTHIAN